MRLRENSLSFPLSFINCNVDQLKTKSIQSVKNTNEHWAGLRGAFGQKSLGWMTQCCGLKLKRDFGCQLSPEILTSEQWVAPTITIFRLHILETPSTTWVPCSTRCPGIFGPSAPLRANAPWGFNQLTPMAPPEEALNFMQQHVLEYRRKGNLIDGSNCSCVMSAWLDRDEGFIYPKYSINVAFDPRVTIQGILR